MKQYDFVRAWVNDADYDIEGPVIVLTIEELREVFEAGSEKGAHDALPQTKERPPGFKKYLTSKDIKITDNG